MVRIKTRRLSGLLFVTCSVAVLLCSAGFIGAQSDAKTQQKEEKRKAEEEQRAAKRKAEAGKKQAEEDRKHREEQEKLIKKYAKFSTPQLRVKASSLSQQIAGSYYGQGLGVLIAKGIWEGKVKERDELLMEIVRRGEAGDSQPANGSGGGRPIGSGTGFFITEDGYLVTNHHVVERGRTVKVRTPQGELTAVLVSFDPVIDLALLKLEGHFSALPVKSSRSVRLGETIATIGFPNPGLQGFSPKLTKGEISSLAGMQDDPKQFQVSLPLQPGNSGGALFDAFGNVVGVVAARLHQAAALATSGTLAENVNYAVKSSFLLSFLESTPRVAEKLKEIRTIATPFEDVVAAIEKATVQVTVY